MRYHAIAAAAAMVLTMGVGAPTIAAADVTAEEATRRVNVAGRQRMLSQRMAKAACLMSTGIAADDHRGQMDAAYALFLQSDAALRVGDPEMGLQEETLNQVLNALSEIDTPWAAYRRVIEFAQREGAVPEDRLMPLNATSLEVLRTMNAAVNTTARAYGGITPDVPLALTVTVDIAGRQRMLTQKAVKEACLMQVADDPAAMAETLLGTLTIFDLSLTALRNGMADVGVMAPPNEQIADQLATVQELWTPVKALLDRAAGGEVLSPADLAELATLTEPLLREMNTAVGLYEFVM